MTLPWTSQHPIEVNFFSIRLIKFFERTKQNKNKLLPFVFFLSFESSCVLIESASEVHLWSTINSQRNCFLCDFSGVCNIEIAGTCGGEDKKENRNFFFQIDWNQSGNIESISSKILRISPASHTHILNYGYSRTITHKLGMYLNIDLRILNENCVKPNCVNVAKIEFAFD